METKKIQIVGLGVTDQTLTEEGKAADAKATGEAIGLLNEDLANKLDTPQNPLVGRYLRVKAVNDDGVPELEWVEAPSGGGSDLDVRINGESIVTDGVAEIPIVKNGNASPLGLAGVYHEYGINVLADRLHLYNNNTWIDKRVFNGAIYNTNLDYAVKAAMTDGKGTEWTAEEQKASRERIGIEWKQLIDETTEEDATKFNYVFVDMNEIIIMISGNASFTRVNFNSSGMTPFYHYTFLRQNKISSNYMHIHPRVGGMRYVESGQVTEDTPEYANSYALVGTMSCGMAVKSAHDKINNLLFDINSTGKLLAGARIQIFGR